MHFIEALSLSYILPLLSPFFSFFKTMSFELKTGLGLLVGVLGREGSSSTATPVGSHT